MLEKRRKEVLLIRNPDWTRDELILALDLFVREGRKQLEPQHPKVIELSKTLNSLGIHGTDGRTSSFRNPQGVSMKLGNILSLDPEYKGAGLSRGAKLDREVWDEFYGDWERLHTLASAIVRASRVISEPQADYQASSSEMPEDEEFPEGRVLTRLHRQRERNAAVVDQKKRSVLSQHGRLACEVCDFDFMAAYGDLGHGFAECHHTVPISQLAEDHKTRLADLAIVCANCHRMLHRAKPVLTVNQLRDIVLQVRRDR